MFEIKWTEDLVVVGKEMKQLQVGGKMENEK